MKWTPKLVEAQHYFRFAHDSIGQKRKYTGEPYWHHTDEVGEIVAVHAAGLASLEDLIIASFGHDTPEDVFPQNPEFNLSVIGRKYGKRVASLIAQLTDVYTSEAYPHLKRATRKLLEASRISVIDDEAKLIKLADFKSNTRSIVEHNEEFARTYLPEMELVMTHLRTPLSEKLWLEVDAQLGDALAKLGMTRTWSKND